MWVTIVTVFRPIQFATEFHIIHIIKCCTSSRFRIKIPFFCIKINILPYSNQEITEINSNIGSDIYTPTYSLLTSGVTKKDITNSRITDLVHWTAARQMKSIPITMAYMATSSRMVIA